MRRYLAHVLLSELRWLALLGALLVSACTAHDTLADSKSNWLRKCDSADDCGSGTDCACGVCTKPCAGSAACASEDGTSAVCIAPIEQGLPASCQLRASAATAGICLQSCRSDAECGNGQRCAEGVCVGADVESASSLSAPEGPQPTQDAASDERDAGQASDKDGSVSDAADAMSFDAEPPTAARDAGEAGAATTTIDVDCRPRYDIVGSFDSHCQYLGGDLAEIYCPHLAVVSVGSLSLVIRHAERIRVGVPVVLTGADPDVTIAAAFANSEVLIGTTREGETSGTLIFDDFRIGEVLRGRLIGVRVSAQPDPVFVCQIAQASFLADFGPGVKGR
jgi:hypothetical protein